ncbi:hypothetical protein BC567DRAFT_211458 [Phyllosticta citribraziliensis]
MSLPSTPAKTPRTKTSSPAGSNATLTPSSASKRRSLAESPTDRRNRVSKALKTNPDGASVLDIASIGDSYHRTAGYLNLGVQELQKIIRPAKNQGSDGASIPKDVSGWIANFISVRDVLRTPQSDKGFSIQMTAIKWFLDKEEFGNVLGPLFNDETTQLPLPKDPPAYLPLDKASMYFKVETGQDRARKSHIRWAHLNVLFVVYRILRLLPSGCVTGAPSPDFENARKTLSFHPEDWTRSLCLLKYASTDLKGKKVSHRGQPTAPEFFTLEEKIGSTSTSFTARRSEVERPFQFEPFDDWMRDMLKASTQVRTTEEKEKVQERAVKAMHTAMKSRDSSIQVSQGQQKSFLLALYEKYGREGIRFPEQRQGEGPLAFFNRSEAQNDAEATRSFYELQSALNKTTAQSRTIEEACTALGFPSDPTRWCLRNSTRTLKPHQVLSLDWALQMITTLGFAYLSSDVGMGKTAVAAALILKLLEERKAEQVGQASGSSGFRPTYKPTLILIPRDAMLSLCDDLKAFPDITAYQWYGPPGNSIFNRAIGTSIEDLIEKLDSFDQNDPLTAHQVVVTTYAKYRAMATHLDDHGLHNTKGKGKAAHVQNDAEELDEQDEEEEEDEAGEEGNNKQYGGKYEHLVCYVEGRFGLVILDQAHKAKNPLTRTHVSISRTRPEQLLGLTSTPIMQSPADLLGYIKLAWEVAKSRDLVGETNFHPSRNAYDPLAEQLTDASVVDLPALLPLLNPASFKTHLGYSTSHRNLISSVEHAQQIVKPILRFCFLRFYKGQDLSSFGLNEVAGGEIPRYKPLVMELQYDKYQQQKHDKTFRALIQDRVIGSNDPFHDGWNDHGHVHPAAHKELVQLASNYYHGRIWKKMGSIKADDIHELKARSDSGFKFLFFAIIGRFVVYKTALERVEWIASLHPKWGVLAGILQEVLYKQKSKVLVFVSSPFTHQILDTFLLHLGIQYASINSSVSMDDRDKAYETFNDPEDLTCVMTVNTNLGCSSFQAQRACHITVLLDFPAFPSPRLFDQLIGRTWRMGQEHSPLFITMTTIATYDHILQGIFAHKAILQTAVLADIPTKRQPAVENANDDQNQDEAAQDQATGNANAEEQQEERVQGEADADEAADEAADGATDEFADDAVRKELDSFIERTTELYMEAVGLSSSRLGWDRASCEQVQQLGPCADATRAYSVLPPSWEEEPDSDLSNDEQQDIVEGPVLVGLKVIKETTPTELADKAHKEHNIPWAPNCVDSRRNFRPTAKQIEVAEKFRQEFQRLAHEIKRVIQVFGVPTPIILRDSPTRSTDEYLSPEWTIRATLLGKTVAATAQHWAHMMLGNGQADIGAEVEVSADAVVHLILENTFDHEKLLALSDQSLAEISKEAKKTVCQSIHGKANKSPHLSLPEIYRKVSEMRVVVPATVEGKLVPKTIADFHD